MAPSQRSVVSAACSPTEQGRCDSCGSRGSRKENRKRILLMSAWTGGSIRSKGLPTGPWGFLPGGAGTSGAAKEKERRATAAPASIESDLRSCRLVFMSKDGWVKNQDSVATTTDPVTAMASIKVVSPDSTISMACWPRVRYCFCSLALRSSALRLPSSTASRTSGVGKIARTPERGQTSRHGSARSHRGCARRLCGRPERGLQGRLTSQFACEHSQSTRQVCGNAGRLCVLIAGP